MSPACRVVRKFWSRELGCQSKPPALVALLSAHGASLKGGVWGFIYIFQTLWNAVFCTIQAIFSPKITENLKCYKVNLLSVSIKFNCEWHINNCYSFQKMFLNQSRDVLFRKRPCIWKERPSRVASGYQPSRRWFSLAASYFWQTWVAAAIAGFMNGYLHYECESIIKMK